MTQHTAPLAMSMFATRADYERALAESSPVFDGYEVAPVSLKADTAEAHTTTADAEQAIAAALAEGVTASLVWGLYGHLPAGGVEHIADYADELAALSAYRAITGRPLPMPTGGMQTLAPAVGIETRHYPTDTEGRAI